MNETILTSSGGGDTYIYIMLGITLVGTLVNTVERMWNRVRKSPCCGGQLELAPPATLQTPRSASIQRARKEDVVKVDKSQ
jgi:hypothetical protein